MQITDYHDFPPAPYFLTVLKHHPEAAYIYVRLWQSNIDGNGIPCYKKQIRNVFLTTPTLFRNKLLTLVDLGLLSVKENPTHFNVDLVPYDDDHFENTCT